MFVLYSLLQRRKTLCQDCCFGGYCGLPVYAVTCATQSDIVYYKVAIVVHIYRPINFIHETKDRWVYCAAFGILVNLFVFVILGVSGSHPSSLSEGN